MLLKKAVLFIVIAFGLSLATSSFALPATGHHYSYFSDANYTSLVGDEYLTCGGLYDLQGYKTPYMIVIDQWSCGDDGWPETGF